MDSIEHNRSARIPEIMNCLSTIEGEQFKGEVQALLRNLGKNYDYQEDHRAWSLVDSL